MGMAGTHGMMEHGTRDAQAVARNLAAGRILSLSKNNWGLGHGDMSSIKASRILHCKRVTVMHKTSESWSLFLVDGRVEG